MRKAVCRALPALIAAFLLSAACSGGDGKERTHHKSRLYTIDGYRILELAGTPEEMGEAHGTLLAKDIRRVLKDVLQADDHRARYKRIIEGTKIMDSFQPEEYRREMKALAKAAGVDYMDVVALQLFGDAERGERPQGRFDKLLQQKCTNFAVFGPATANGECIVGRNFDYWYQEVAGCASIIIHYRPEKARSFVTLSWASVVNGWTLMNDKGLVVANNNAYGKSESLQGISTCFMQRHIIQNASSVEEGIEIARKGPRAVGTVMLVAGGDPPDAVELEFDHETFVVRKAKNGCVLAANRFLALGRDKPIEPGVSPYSRYGILLGLIRKNHGKIDRSMNFAAARGVPLSYINLHCAMLFPKDGTFLVSMGRVPACDGRFRRFRMTDKGIVIAK